MTTPDAVHTLTRALALKTQVLAHKAPATARHITRQLDGLHDGYPATASGSGAGGTGNGLDTSTERAALARDDVIVTDTGDIVTVRMRELVDNLEAALLAVTHALKTCDTYAPRAISEADLRNLRCQGIDHDQPCPEQNISDPLRKDRRCIPCGRTVDAARARRSRRAS